jgi:hypothetical protein
VSIAEIRTVLAQSLSQARKCAVIVSHSFELLNRPRDRSNEIVVRRFERFCELLNEMRAQAPTQGFTDLDPARLIDTSGTVAPLLSAPWRTASRMMEQAMGTILYG